MMVCKQVIYSGRVQGVGFRYTAKRLTSGLCVVGYVRNLSTGDVELAVEGEDSEVGILLERIAQRMAGYIHSADVREIAPQGFSGFEIRR